MRQVNQHGDEGLPETGSTFEVQVEAELPNVRGSKLLRHQRHATDTSVASKNARKAGRARLARRALDQFGLSGLFGSSGLSRLSGLSSTILDETRNDSGRLIACLARIIHDGSSRSGARHARLARLVRKAGWVKRSEG